MHVCLFFTRFGRLGFASVPDISESSLYRSMYTCISFPHDVIQHRRGVGANSCNLFFWSFERLIWIFSAIFWYCMITRQLIDKHFLIYYARNSKKKSSDEQFLQAPRNWQKCSALASCFKYIIKPICLKV
jgi:hypothetical protein